MNSYFVQNIQTTVMASPGSVAPPERFDFKTPEVWPMWIKRFERYASVTGLVQKDEEVQVDTLLYCMGEASEDILATFGLNDANQKKWAPVRDKFKDYFVKRKNVVFERAKFNRRVQEEGEPVDAFITSLYNLAENCSYAGLREELIRDRIVIGIRDISLSERLQCNEELTLAKAITSCRQQEAVKQQQSTLRSAPVSAQVDAVRGKQPWKRQPFTDKKKPSYPPRKPFVPHKQSSHKKECHRCGESPPHKREVCPARDADCHKCGKKGHYGKKCNTMNLKAVEVEEQPYAFLGAVSSGQERSEEDFHREVLVNGHSLEFKVDTGADVTIISEKDYRLVCKDPLMKPDVQLKAANQLPFKKVLGVVQAVVCFKGESSLQKLYVVDSIPIPLLGKPAITALQVVSVNSVNSTSYKDMIMKKFPSLFSGLGQLSEEYRIKLGSNVEPHAISAPRRIALPLLPKVKQALDTMVTEGVIRKLGPNEPSEWCSGIVVVPKPNGNIRICVDLTMLNKAVVRPRYQLPTVDYTLAQLKQAKVFTKLDANAGFHQVKLSEDSQLLTTFLTPFGRFCYTRLPFGISSGPEYFTAKMNQILRETDVHCQMDDILVATEDVPDHERVLFPVLQKLQDAGVTLNPDKCEFMTDKITFVGHTITAKGIQAENRKVQAIVEMDTPSNIHELRRFLGMANQMAKFSPNLTELTKPLRELLSKKNSWCWGPAQETAFQHVKIELSSPTVLAMYNPTRETKISADASSYGLGAVLLQKDENNWRPVYFASRSMTPTEQRYAQVEKETLAITWACDKFAEYLVGLDFVIETDHKPLVALLEKKPLDDVPPRILRFRMRLMRFRYTVCHIPGKEMYTADTLSRAPLASTGDTHSKNLQEDVEAFVSAILSNLPATENRLQQIHEAQYDDEVCQKIREYTLRGWPDKHNLSYSSLKPYLQHAAEFTVQDGLLMMNDRILIPASLRLEVLDQIHHGHLGIVKCRERAKQSVWWPGLSRQIESMVENCKSCQLHRAQTAEPLMPTPLPDRPWQKVAVDICEHQKIKYIVIVDYYSRYIECLRLQSETASSVIEAMKATFARHGIPEIVRSDNGPQFAGREFQDFANAYGFTLITSSPRYPRSNGEAERAVQTAKALLKKNKDLYLGLLAYRSTPLQNGFSPAELLMGRKIRTTLVQHPSQLQPRSSPVISDKEERMKCDMRTNHDVRYRARDLSELVPGQPVYVRDTGNEGVVERQAENCPRSYIIQTPKSTLRRNRRSVISLPSPDHKTQSTSVPQDVPLDIPPISASPKLPSQSVVTRSGRPVQRPAKLDL